MKILHSPKELEMQHALPIVATIGNFDGVHLGHQALIRQMQELANSISGKIICITFSPHPLSLLQSKNQYLIQTDAERGVLLERYGVDYLLEIPFTREVSNLLPGEFLYSWILPLVGLKHIYVGDDFRFGKDRSGDLATLDTLLKQHNITHSVFPSFHFAGVKPSSSLIRTQIASGEVHIAKELLGRHYFMMGVVVKGDGRGKFLGFPTANMELDQKRIIPSRGVYATRTTIRNECYLSLTNIGTNPTFLKGEELRVETHLLDFSLEIYGEVIEVEFLYKLREERKFSSSLEFQEQLHKDIAKIRKERG